MIVARNITLDDIEKQIWEEAREEVDIEKEMEINWSADLEDYIVYRLAYEKLRQAIIDGRV